MNSLSTVKKKKKEDGGHPSIHSKLQSHQFYQTIIPLMLLTKFQRKTGEKNLEITVIISSNSAIFLRSLFLHSGEKNNSESEQSIS